MYCSWSKYCLYTYLDVVWDQVSRVPGGIENPQTLFDIYVTGSESGIWKLCNGLCVAG